jgi:hypothetical protein
VSDISGLASVTGAGFAIPADIRKAGKEAQETYRAALGFERTLLEQLTQTMTKDVAGDGDDAGDAIMQLRESGAYEQLREDLRLRAALDRLAADVKRIPVELAQARESIWTPEKEKPETAAKLWTPGSKESA